MKIVAALCVLLCLSCHAQVFDDGIGDVIRMLQTTMDIMFDQKEKISTLEEHLKALTASQEEHLKALTASQEDHKTKLAAIEDQNQQMQDNLSAQNMKMISLEDHLKDLSTSQGAQNLKMISLEEILLSGIHNNTENILNTLAIDECSDGSHRCSEFAQCIDSTFSYECRCIEGYSGDGFHCEDIECLKSPCHPKAECQHSIGNFTCSCKKPYKGDGHTCELDCQSAGDLGCLTLVLTSMSWEDSKKECEQLGMRLLEDIPSRQHFRLIWNAFKNEGNLWIGARGRKWVTSGEPIRTDLYYKGHPRYDLDACIVHDSEQSVGADEGLFDNPCTNKYYPLCQFLPSH